MTQEQIKRAANSYIDDFLYNHIDYTVIHDNYETGRNNAICEFGPDIFKAGAQWRINSVWHSGNEVPKKHKDLLIELKNMEFHICQFKDGDSFLGYYDDREFIAFEIISWAYVEDLLPADSK